MNAETPDNAVLLDGNQKVLLVAMMSRKGLDLPVYADDFYPGLNREAFHSIQRLKGQGKVASLRGVLDDLTQHKKLKLVGGPSQVLQLADLQPYDTDIEYAVGEIKRFSNKRKSEKIREQLEGGLITDEEAGHALIALGSSNSFSLNGKADADQFPEPPADIVFHGLAGEIVRRIEPHTESDNLGLLIQMLVAFGNAIGRGAYATVESTRHHLNLFAVLAGDTSKGRKGTSWNHVKALFGRVDETWARNCQSEGLSSGEGVIHNVRDPLVERFKRKDGSEGEKTQPGIDDKRLCVQEGEFARVLKVMAREGNTLSAVLRNAWDSGNLRSMTKNSDERATGAHISIIAHITREELSRLMTETDSWNGFANRFLFLGVRRAKCLPEGGNLEAGALNDLVTRLHRAIDFAWDAGQITRDDEARKLWAAVYPKLSEGKPGLVGAITARAEAQVLRLSCLYALLDCSPTVTVDHHRAALELWNYCDRSAEWLFGDATGNARANRILDALRAAGRNGLTRTDISHGIFQRHIKPAALDSALQALVMTGKARSVPVDTGGRKAEKWMAA